jgi:uncharacterized membrane protein YgcG
VNLYSFFLIMNAMLIFLLIIGVVVFFVFLAIESYRASDLGEDEVETRDKGCTRCRNDYARYMFYISIVLAVLTTLAAIGFAYSKFGEFSDTLKGIKTATIGGDGDDGGISSSGGSSGGGGSSSKKSGGAVKWNEWKVKNGASSLKVTADRIEGSKDAWIKLPNGSELKVNSGVPFKQGGPAEWDVTVPGDTNEGFITLTVGEPGPYQYKEMLQVDGLGKLVHTNPIRPARAPSGLSNGMGYASRAGGRNSPAALPGANNSNFLNNNQLGVTPKGYQPQQQQQKKSLGNQNFNQNFNQNQRIPNQNFNQNQRIPNQNFDQNNPFQQQQSLGGGGLGGGGGYNQFGGGGGGGISLNDFSPDNSGNISFPDPSKTMLADNKGILPKLGKKNKVTVNSDGRFHTKQGGLDLVGPVAPL